MTLFKACQRCGGDLRESGDIYGDYFQCVQCGFLVDLPEEWPLVKMGEREHVAA